MKRTAFEVVADAIRYVAALQHPQRDEMALSVKDVALAADRSVERVKEVLAADYGAVALRVGSAVRWDGETVTVFAKEVWPVVG